MANLQGFDANQHEAGFLSFEPLPEGYYVAMITASEQKETRAKDGSYLATTWQIVEGEHVGRKVFFNFNLWNASAKARDIALREFAAVCQAVGVLTPRDSQELHDTPVVIKLGLERRSDNKEKLQNKLLKCVSCKDYHAAKQAAPPANNAPARSNPFANA